MSERRSELKAVAADEMSSAKTPEHEFMSMTSQMMEDLSQVNNSLVSLAQTSWRHTQEAADEMRLCQSPKDMIDIQIKVGRQAVDEYMDEAKKLGDLVMKMSTDAMSYLRMPR